MKIYKYFLLHNKKLKPWIKYWLYIKSKDKNYVLSDILDGTSFYLENSSNKNFNLFQINGNSMQDGTPTPSNPVEIESAGDTGYITESISNSDNTQSQNFTIPCQEPMRSIGNVRDEFIKQDGLWYEKHVIGQVVLNGSESWGFGASGEQNINVANVYISSILISNYGQGLCNYFIRGTSKTANNLRFGANDKQLWFYLKSTDFANVNDWKTWLSTHNTEVIYQLAEPNYIECTHEQKEALESITQAYTYKQGTNINSTDETPAYLNIQYFMEV